MAASDFWDRQQEAQATVERLKVLKKVIEPWNKANQSCRDLPELLDMVDENQADSLKELHEEVKKVAHEIENLEFQRLCY